MTDSAAPPTKAPESVSGAPALPREALENASGYAFPGPALDPGALLWDGRCLPDVQIRIPLRRGHRYGQDEDPAARRGAAVGAGGAGPPSVVQQVVGSRVFKSLARSPGTQVGREITRSIFGTARRRR